MKDRPATEAFVGDLRRALLDLYDPAGLAKSPLREVLSVGWQPDPASALRRLLVLGIEALRPDDTVPAQADVWRIYRVLKYRYVDLIPQREIASSLALSVRQLRRHEAAALQVLANHLWRHHGLQLKANVATHGEERTASAAAGAHGDELQWLRTSFPSEATSINEIIEAALKTVAPLLDATGVRVESNLPETMPRLAMHTITMRQALVSILNAAARCVPRGRVEIATAVESSQISVGIVAVKGRTSPLPLGREDCESLEMARQLAALSGGSLVLSVGAGPAVPFRATLVLPVAQQLDVLVADDNVDTRQLFQRYLEGSRYAFVGAREPQQALALAMELAPKVIVLDVMLPGIDGWELLGRLREHPATRHIPVIVCTILCQERLALTLGAAAFLRKPVSRGVLLEALDDVIRSDMMYGS